MILHTRSGFFPIKMDSPKYLQHFNESIGFNQKGLVLRAGIEPARPYGHRIFLPATVFTAYENIVCGLDFIFVFYFF